MLTQEQKEARCYGVGGSDIGVLCGLSTYKTPYELFLSKRRPDEMPYVDNTPPSPAARRGHALESLALDLYEEHIERPLSTRNAPMKYHKDYDFLFANYDGLVWDYEKRQNNIVEAKTAYAYLKKTWGEPGTAQIPKTYLLQVAHYVEVEDCSYADIIVYFLDDTWAVYRYNRNLAFGKSILDMGVRFWEENVLKKIPPAPMSTADVIKMFPEPNEIEKIAITEELEAVLTEYKNAKAKVLAYENIAETCKVQIIMHMKDHTTLVDSQGYTLANFKFRNGARILDTALLKAEQPDIYNTYCKARTPTRAFILKTERESND